MFVDLSVVDYVAGRRTHLKKDFSVKNTIKRCNVDHFISKIQHFDVLESTHREEINILSQSTRSVNSVDCIFDNCLKGLIRVYLTIE